jgi:hypothetical protein
MSLPRQIDGLLTRGQYSPSSTTLLENASHSTGLLTTLDDRAFPILPGDDAEERQGNEQRGRRQREIGLHPNGGVAAGSHSVRCHGFNPGRFPRRGPVGRRVPDAPLASLEEEVSRALTHVKMLHCRAQGLPFRAFRL